MARTVSDLISRVRQVLQDEDQNGYRYPTANVVGYLNDAVLEARRLRPDLFIGKYRKDLPQVSTNPSTDYSTVFLPLPDTYFTAAVGFVAGSLEFRDDEFAVDGRAVYLRDSLSKILMGAG